jgi:hypothetical protein
VTFWAALLAVATVTVAASAVRAQSFVEEESEDACDRARALDAADVSPIAQHLRRSCRLERFGNRLAAERRQELIADETLRQESVDGWLQTTQPSRVTRPMAVEGFLGTGLASYGLSYAWDFLRRGELVAWLGWRPVSCQDQSGNETADCGRTSFGLRGRWYLVDRDFTPFLGTGLAITSSHLQAISSTQTMNSSNLLVGSGRANSVDAAAGFELGVRAFRMSVEYVFEYAFYTGANLNDAQKTPSEDLRVALRDSLKSDRNGLRFQVGFAF